MELLKEISEESLGIKRHSCSKSSIRKAARAIVFDKKGKIAILNATKYHYHKIAGGGVEKGESIKEALKREILEEVGYESKIGKPIGMTIEYRNNFKLLQISYCYFAKIVGKSKGVKFTGSEKEEGFKLEWLSLNEAIKIIRADGQRSEKKEYYESNFIVERELTFLKKAKKLLEN